MPCCKPKRIIFAYVKDFAKPEKQLGEKTMGLDMEGRTHGENNDNAVGSLWIHLDKLCQISDMYTVQSLLYVTIKSFRKDITERTAVISIGKKLFNDKAHSRFGIKILTTGMFLHLDIHCIEQFHTFKMHVVNI